MISPNSRSIPRLNVEEETGPVMTVEEGATLTNERRKTPLTEHCHCILLSGSSSYCDQVTCDGLPFAV